MFNLAVFAIFLHFCYYVLVTISKSFFQIGGEFSFMPSPRSKNFLKHHCSDEFIVAFRRVLYNKKASWPEKCLCFALFDHPSRDVGAFSLIARKLNRFGSQICIWKKKISDNPKIGFCLTDLV